MQSLRGEEADDNVYRKSQKDLKDNLDNIAMIPQEVHISLCKNMFAILFLYRQYIAILSVPAVDYVFLNFIVMPFPYLMHRCIGARPVPGVVALRAGALGQKLQGDAQVC
jgi:hypothetical protein